MTMAVYFSTSAAKALLSAFDARIEQTEQEGKITTWEKSDDGKYYTHKAKEWAKKGWFRPATSDDRLTFNIIKPKNSDVTPLVYAYYHGHLIETFLNHFDNKFTTAQATALAMTDDNCSS
jgi:hypothetical protein